ncbi:MAG: SGNH/GDSL hydrolase family protein [Planctomycetaceae bacterium]|nr:SGNH/GDSL hydrolase family protein [Planctomycetaceae bacterium]
MRSAVAVTGPGALLRRGLLFVLLSLPLTAGANRAVAGSPAEVLQQSALKQDAATKDEKQNVLWYSLEHFNVEGREFDNLAAPYDRLPATAEKEVRPPVWSLSRHSAGLCTRFVTDATSISCRWTLTSASLAMPHMPATGVSGVDLYVRGEDGRWWWLANGRPSAQSNTSRLVGGIPAGTREYMLYLPLYNGVSSVEIGLPDSARIAPAGVRPSGQTKPVVFYGTSITQGGCASRPGMVHTAILGRMLDVPVVNMGFSGNGRMELEVTKYLAQIDASVFVLDCLPNIDAAQVKERTEPVVRLLREKHPETPILLVEDRTYSDAFLVQSKRDRNDTSRVELKKAFERLTEAGVKHLYYLEGEKLLGDDNEGTVDSSHPTDLGFMRQAEAFREAIRPLLKTSN